MKKGMITPKLKSQWIKLTIISAAISLALFNYLLTDIIRARIININNVVEQLKQKQNKVVVQRGFEYEKGLDFKCMSWLTNPVGSGWTNQIDDSDFYLDFYVPPGKKAIICTTPILATAITAATDKPFLYEVYPTDYGLRVRIIIGLSEVREPCKSLTGNVNCVNSILSQQVIVRYEP